MIPGPERLDVVILKMLFAKSGDYVSGADLAEEGGVSRAAIWKHIEQLQALGYPIEAQPHHGYRLLEPPDVWCADEIAARVPNDKGIVWRPILLRETASTNDVASRESQAGASEGLLVLADRQTMGRGRQGRRWESLAGAGLYASALLRPHWRLAWTTRLTVIASVALAEAIEHVAHVGVQIKWPNDLVAGPGLRKMGGILVEIQADPELIRGAVVGFGINVSHEPHDFPQNLRERATSLAIETGKHVRRADVLVEILGRLAACYREDFERVREKWKERSATLGRLLRVAGLGGEQSGAAVGLDSDGALLLRTASGATVSVTAGDVEFLG
jgi:BirA family biotin operon repressor/biotin-[acetyl-CoA-carboxylase] ligase